MQLTSLEYQILEFVSQKGITRKSEIIKHFETASDIEICIMRLTLPTPNIYFLPPDKTSYLVVIHENSLSNDVKNDYKLKLTSLGSLTLNNYQYDLQVSEKINSKNIVNILEIVLLLLLLHLCCQLLLLSFCYSSYNIHTL